MSISLEAGKKEPREKMEIMEPISSVNVSCNGNPFYGFLVLSRDCIQGLSNFTSIFSWRMLLNHKYVRQILKELPFLVTGGGIKCALPSALCDCQSG